MLLHITIVFRRKEREEEEEKEKDNPSKKKRRRPLPQRRSLASDTAVEAMEKIIHVFEAKHISPSFSLNLIFLTGEKTF